MRTVIIICLVILIGYNTTAFAEDYREVMGQRQVSFNEIGSGKFSETNSEVYHPEIRAYYARQESTVKVFFQFQNWLESLDFCGETLGQIMQEDPDVLSIVRLNLFRDFRLEDFVFPDGTVKTTLIRTWNGTELARVLDRLYRERNFVSEVISNPTLPDLSPTEGRKDDLPANYEGYTGVVIDTRGYQIRPSMAPKIFDTSSVEVYGTMDVELQYVIDVGIVGYGYNLEEAIKDGRVGDNPLVIKAVGRRGNAKDQAIISLKDAKFIREMANNSTILTECKVMFIIDERK